MTRQIDVHDRVRISHNGIVKNCTIREIRLPHIYFSEHPDQPYSVICPQSGKWTVYKAEHLSFTFLPCIVPQLTKNLPIDLHILSKLDDRDLVNLLSTCLYTRECGLRDELWKAKLDIVFGDGVSQENSQENSQVPFDHINLMSWKTLYVNSISIDRTEEQADKAGKQGKLYLLKYLYGFGIQMTNKGLRESAGRGHIHILEWMFRLGKVPGPRAINKCIVNGHLSTVKWLIAKGVRPMNNSVDTAAISGQLEILKYLTVSPLNLPIRPALMGEVLATPPKKLYKDNRMAFPTWNTCFSLQYKHSY